VNVANLAITLGMAATAGMILEPVAGFLLAGPRWFFRRTMLAAPDEGS
jgi:hypothetical protein